MAHHLLLMCKAGFGNKEFVTCEVIPVDMVIWFGVRKAGDVLVTLFVALPQATITHSI